MANNTGNDTFLWQECHKGHTYFLVIYSKIAILSAVFGILGNVASVIVLVQPSMRSSTSILLVALAVYDTLVLTIQLLPRVNYLSMSYLLSKLFNRVEQSRLQSVNNIALTGTIYTTVVVTIERAVVVVFPLKAKLVCTKTRASVACVAVFLWSLIYSVPTFIVVSQKSLIRNDKNWYDYVNGTFYRYVYQLYLHTVFHGVLPVGVIIILNIAIIQRLCMRGRRTIHQVSSRGDNQTQLTVMIIVLTWIFCASRVLFVALIYLYEQDMSEYERYQRMNSTKVKRVLDCLPTKVIARATTEVMIIVNSATNFIVYSIFGHKFRRCFHELCCSRHCLQAHRSPPETQAPSGNKLSTSASSLHPNILQERQRSNSPSRTSALLAVPEMDTYISTASPAKTSALLAVPEMDADLSTASPCNTSALLAVPETGC